MIDKYSKIEEKVEEGRRRAQVIEKSLLTGLALEDDLSKVFDWEIVSVKNDVSGTRLNVVMVKTETSVARFVLNKEKGNIEKAFQAGFLDNFGQKESLSLRIS